MIEILLIVIICLLVVVIFLALLILFKKGNNANISNVKEVLNDNNELLLTSLRNEFNFINNNINNINRDFKEFRDKFSKDFSESLDRFNQYNSRYNDQINDKLKDNKESLDKMLQKISDLGENEIKKLNEEFKSINSLLTNNNTNNIRSIKESLDEFKKDNSEKISLVNQTVKENLESIRKDNNDKLNDIKGVVDEKLQKSLEDKLNQSFKNVFEQINSLNKTIGQIETLATDVSSLKNVLANVKTKGILGEVVLGNLIRDILSENQYEENVATKKGSNERVEYAIKMPGNDGEFVYLPIDSKFPTESYNKILDAIDEVDKSKLDAARKELGQRIKDFAKDISTKYIDEPNTTGFGIMFLPIEGLYSEVINLGLFEEIQNKYKVIITGPSTFAALLNALQMGFKTLVIQKKSAEVFNLLSAVKTEFNKFADALAKTQNKVNQANDELEKLVTTRTRVMQRKLDKVEEIPGINSKEILGISDEK